MVVGRSEGIRFGVMEGEGELVCEGERNGEDVDVNTGKDVAETCSGVTETVV